MGVMGVLDMTIGGVDRREVVMVIKVVVFLVV